MIVVEDGRGKKSIELKEKNIKKVEDYFKEFPGATIRQCSCEVGLSELTVSKHIKALLSR